MIDAVAQIISSKPWYHIIEVAPGVCTPGRYDPKPLLDTMGFRQTSPVRRSWTLAAMTAFSPSKQSAGGQACACDGSSPLTIAGFAIAHKLLGSKVEYDRISL
jgi:hypothetical protein